MTLKGSTAHWGSVAKLFHWTIVLLILAQGVIGLIMVELPKKPNIIPIYTFHKSLGLTVLLLAILRLIWRLFDVRPAEPATMSHAQVMAARVGHALLYVLLFAVPLSGWLFDSASSLRPLYWWGIVQMPSLTGGPDDQLKEIGHETHEWLFWLLILVAAGHATAALVHHFYHRDDVLRRMLPGRRTASGPTP
ncbi:cytochrome b [Dokdonella soli]|uniref:Cytochrome b n=1 Tax=Dokdonella soli TaxID=529810 RepID=A0ABP3TIY5_9GAMM